MANPVHLRILKQGGQQWDQWRKANKDLKPDLSFSDLNSVNLGSANLSSANLEGVDLSSANLEGANLNIVSLRGANLSACNLRDATLHGAHLEGADFSFANLHGANLRETSLIEAKLNNAVLTGACIQDWKINNNTSFSNIKCEYIYQRYEVVINGESLFYDRFPRDPKATFKLREFESLVRQQSYLSISLVFRGDMDWEAFHESLKNLRDEYQAEEITVQSIERRGEDFVIRLETSAAPSKMIEIEASAKRLYQEKMNLLAAQISGYEKRLDQAHDEKASLMGVIKAMAESQKQVVNQTTINAGGSNIAAIQSGDGSIHQVTQNIGANLDKITKLIQSLKTQAQGFPEDQKADVEIVMEDLESDLADEKKREPKRLARRIFALWGVVCAVSAGVAGVADFSNNLLSLAEYLNVEIPIEMIQQNPHFPNVLPGK